MKKNKRVWVLILLALLFIGILPKQLNALAHLNANTGVLDNEVGFGDSEISITENFDGWKQKEVRVTADNKENSVPVVVRVLLVPRAVDKDGNYVDVDFKTLSAPVNNKIPMGDLVFEMDENWADNWFYKDGFFYYKGVLKPGETTEPLLKKVTITENTAELRKKYTDVKILVEVLSDALQAENNAPQKEWNVSVNNDTVSP